MNYISDHKIRNTHSHHLPEQAMVDFDLDKLINNTYLQWQQVTPGTTAESRNAYLEKTRYKSYFVWLQKAIGELYGISEPITAQNWDQISDQIRKAHQNPDFYMDVLKNKCKYQKVIVDTYWNPGSDNGRPELFTPAFRLDLFFLGYKKGLRNHDGAAIPMNLMKNKVADYIVTGQWAKKAYQEAQKYGKANKIASSEDKTFSYIPDCSDLPISPDADYVYICENNTIYGTKFKKLPNTKGKTLVADVSSCFLSEPVDVSKYGIIYGGVQKNIGPAGMVISIIREDLITDDVLEGTPTMLKFKTQADAGSLYNTPNCYCIYVCGKVFKWLKKMGGLEEMQRRNIEKAKILYDFLDQSKLFKGTVVPEDRSLMNVPFVTGDKDMDAKFVKEAKEAGLVNLKGHRTVGGMRASIYNAMPMEGVEKLVAFMKKFEEAHQA